MASITSQTQYIQCPFCQGVLEPKTGKQKCPECSAQLEIDDRLECIFVEKSTFRLPIHGTVCGSCGLVQGEDNQECGYCGRILNNTPH